MPEFNFARNEFRITTKSLAIKRIWDRIIGARLYDESRRKTVLARPKLDELKKVLKMNDWNQYEIRAEGKRIRLSINGFQTVDYTEAEQGIAEQGCICVQIHAGPPSQASYKDITIEEIK